MRTVLFIVGAGMALIIAAVLYHYSELEDARTESYKRGYDDMRNSIKPVSARVDTVRDTVFVSRKKPRLAPTPEQPSINPLAEQLREATEENSTLRSWVDNLLKTRVMEISDTRAKAVITYYPVDDHYDGNLTYFSVNTDSDFTYERPPAPEEVTHFSFNADAAYAGYGVEASASASLAHLGDFKLPDIGVSTDFQSSHNAFIGARYKVNIPLFQDLWIGARYGYNFGVGRWGPSICIGTTL